VRAAYDQDNCKRSSVAIGGTFRRPVRDDRWIQNRRSGIGLYRRRWEGNIETGRKETQCRPDWAGWAESSDRFSALKMESVCSSETLLSTCKSTRRNNTEEHQWHLYRCDDSRSHTRKKETQLHQAGYKNVCVATWCKVKQSDIHLRRLYSYHTPPGLTIHIKLKKSVINTWSKSANLCHTACNFIAVRTGPFLYLSHYINISCGAFATSRGHQSTHLHWIIQFNSI
jgi:hypothetical protein